MVVFVFRSPAHAQPAEATLREKFLQMDIPGTGTVMAALLCYILALGWAGVKMPWNSPNVIGTLVGYILLSVLFVGIQWFQGERAAIVPRIINDRNAASLCAYISLYDSVGGFEVIMGLHSLQQKQHDDVLAPLLSTNLFPSDWKFISLKKRSPKSSVDPGHV